MFLVLLCFRCSNNDDSSNLDEEETTEKIDYTLIDHLDYSQMAT